MPALEHTRYGYMTNSEFLSQVDSSRAHSPIIAELCKRLEEAERKKELDNRVLFTCPVCEAELILDQKTDEEFTLKVQE